MLVFVLLVCFFFGRGVRCLFVFDAVWLFTYKGVYSGVKFTKRDSTNSIVVYPGRVVTLWTSDRYLLMGGIIGSIEEIMLPEASVTYRIEAQQQCTVR